MATLSAAEPTWHIEPTISWCERTPWNFRTRNWAGSIGVEDEASDITASGDGVVERGKGEVGLHQGVDGVADDSVRPEVLERAQVQLPFAGGVLGDVGEPDLGWARRR